MSLLRLLPAETPMRGRDLRARPRPAPYFLHDRETHSRPSYPREDGDFCDVLFANVGEDDPDQFYCGTVSFSERSFEMDGTRVKFKWISIQQPSPNVYATKVYSSIALLSDNDHIYVWKKDFERLFMYINAAPDFLKQFDWCLSYFFIENEEAEGGQHIALWSNSTKTLGVFTELQFLSAAGLLQSRPADLREPFLFSDIKKHPHHVLEANLSGQTFLSIYCFETSLPWQVRSEIQTYTYRIDNPRDVNSIREEHVHIADVSSQYDVKDGWNIQWQLEEFYKMRSDIGRGRSSIPKHDMFVHAINSLDGAPHTKTVFILKTTKNMIKSLVVRIQQSETHNRWVKLTYYDDVAADLDGDGDSVIELASQSSAEESPDLIELASQSSAEESPDLIELASQSYAEESQPDLQSIVDVLELATCPVEFELCRYNSSCLLIDANDTVFPDQSGDMFTEDDATKILELRRKNRLRAALGRAELDAQLLKLVL